jgi:hypothetical protein
LFLEQESDFLDDLMLQLEKSGVGVSVGAGKAGNDNLGGSFESSFHVIDNAAVGSNSLKFETRIPKPEKNSKFESPIKFFEFFIA